MIDLIIKFHEFATSSSIFPVIEFAIVTFLIMMTYLAFFYVFGRGKTALKFMLSSLIGLTGYTLGKAAVIIWVVKPLIAQTLQSNPFL